jgi:hypothetical protein
MARPTGSPKTPGSGRQRGTPNKRQVLSREIARAYVDDPTYRAALKARLEAGTAPGMETLLWQLAYGRPMPVSDDGDSLPLTITIQF